MIYIITKRKGITLVIPFLIVDRGTCLGRSRLTAIPCFVFVISSLQTKALQPQLAPAEPTKTDSSPHQSANKKGHNKSYSLFYGVVGGT